MRYGVGILAIVLLAGCTGHRSSAPPVSRRVVVHGGVRRCLRAWNGEANAFMRRTTVPPRGPYRPTVQRPGLSPRGAYEAIVGLSPVLTAAGTNSPAVCYVYFRFPHGDHGGPAVVAYPEVDRAAGIYGSPTIATGRNTDTGGRIYRQDASGRLHPTDRFQPT
jgi:hypothetical protein